MANYLNVPSGSSATTPDQAGLAVGTTSMDIRVQLAMNDWTPASFSNIVNQYVSGGGSGSRWYLGVSSSAFIQYGFFNSTPSTQIAFSSITLPFTDATPMGIRALHNVTAGTVDFYSATDFSSWSAFGAQQTGLATVGMSVAGTAPIVRLGTDIDAEPAAGKYTKLQVLVNAATILNWDMTTATLGTGTWVATSGETWTRTGTASVIADVETQGGLNFLRKGDRRA